MRLTDGAGSCSMSAAEPAADPRLRKPKGKAVAQLPPTATKPAAAYTNKSV